jgi:hypothetical protein
LDRAILGPGSREEVMATPSKRRRKTAKGTAKTKRLKPINWREFARILNTAVKDGRFRNSLLTSPEKALSQRNYKVHPAAAKFFKSLSRARFNAAAKRFKPSDPHATWFGEAFD